MARSPFALAHRLRRKKSQKAINYSDQIGNKIAHSFLLEAVIKLFGVSSAVVISLAMAYDVGFFYGIDINIFTFFTLSEHVLFTIESLPLSFGVFIIAALLTYIINSETDRFRFLVYYNKKLVLFVMSGFVIFIIITPIYIYYYDIFAGFPILRAKDNHYQSFLAGMYSFAFVVSTALLLATNEKLYKYKSIIFIIVIYTAIFFDVFCLGYLTAKKKDISNSDNMLLHSVRIKNDDEFSGRIIRSGDKGVLFFDVGKNEIVFFKWDNIEEIRSRPTSASLDILW